MDNTNETGVATTRSLFAAKAAEPTDGVLLPAEGEDAVQETAEATEPVAETTAVEEQPAPAESEGVDEASENVPDAEEHAQGEAVAEADSVSEAAPVENAPKTLKELQAERDALDKDIKEKQDAEHRSVIAQIAAVMKTYNIPVAKLVSALGGMPNPRKGVAAPILFKDDQGHTWTGRGKLPNWLKGKNPEDYRITE